MWDFSWMERRWSGAGYECWDTALDELVERGYDTLRIDAYPHLLAEDPEKEWELLPVWNAHDWGCPAPLAVKVGPALVEFIGKCRDRDIKVGLSTWFREDRSKVRERIHSPERHAAIWKKTLDYLGTANLLDSVIYVDFCNEWPAWAPFFAKSQKEGPKQWHLESSLSWMREAIACLRADYPNIPYTFSFSDELNQWRGRDLGALDFLEPHLWMALYSGFYDQIGFSFNFFNPEEYAPVVLHAEKLYRSDPDFWKGRLKEGIENLADWSRASGLPLVTTESWAIVNYKDGPGLDWGWVKELCAYGVETAVETGRWSMLCTSNFCGPQFVGMWRDVEWHQRLTRIIKNAAC